MSLLLDALKEAEKSRKEHRQEEPERDSVSPQDEDHLVLDLDLVQTEDATSSKQTASKPHHEPDSEREGTRSVDSPSTEKPAAKELPATAAVAPPQKAEGTNTASVSTDTQTIDNDHQTPTSKITTPTETKASPKTVATALNSNARVAAEVFQNREKQSSQTKSRLPALLLLLVLVIIVLVALYFLLMPKDEASFTQSRQTTTAKSPAGEFAEFVDTSIATIPTAKQTNAVNDEALTATADRQLDTPEQTNKQADLNKQRPNEQQAIQSQQTTAMADTDATALQQLTRQSSHQSTAKPRGTPSVNQPENRVSTEITQHNKKQAQNPEIKISKRQLSADTSQSLTEANLALEQGNLTAAELAFRQILRRSPGNLTAASSLGQLLLQRGMADEAEGLYLQVLDQDPENLAAKIALINISANDPANLSAGSQLKQLLIEHPNLPYLHASLGNFYARRNDWTAAQSAYFEAFALDNTNANYAYNLAISLDQLGKFDIAANYYEKALELHNDQIAQFNISDVKHRLNEIKGAVQ